MRPTGRPTRRGPRLLLRAALVGVLLTLSVGVLASPAQAATIDCTPMGDPVCKDIEPTVDCVWSNGDGTSTVVWGYTNPSPTTTIRIDYGGKNKISGGPDNQGQPTLYPPGTYTNLFVNTVTGNRTWTLGNNKVSFDSSTPACLTKPVSVIGNGRALLLGIALLLAVGLPVLASRRVGREVLA